MPIIYQFLYFNRRNIISSFMTNTLTPLAHFPSLIYTIDKPEFLDVVKLISTQYLFERKQAEPLPNPLYPVQTNGFFHEEMLADFNTFIAQSAWTILDSQGHAMADKETFFQEMWCQEHNYGHGHEEHIHGDGNQISGFYFVDAPADACKVAIHDPRPARRQVSLPEADLNKITDASETVLFIPQPGRMYFINSWLPHSVTRNTSQEPTRLVHFNLGVRASTRPVADGPVII
jgi:uncharacterized protein (TIGR02466 family)